MKRLAFIIIFVIIGMLVPVSVSEAAEVESWLTADLHIHSTNSDGKLSPQAIVTKYENAGFNIIAVTDHDKFTQVTSSKLVIIPAMEMSYGNQKAPYYKHILTYFITSQPKNLDDAKSQGAIISVAHPTTWSVSKKPSDFPKQVNAYESYNGQLIKQYGNYVPSWATALKVKTGGSDAHSATEYTKTKFQVYAKKNLDSIKKAILAGKVRQGGND